MPVTPTLTETCDRGSALPTGQLSVQWRPPKSLFKRWSAHSSSFLRLRPRSTQQARLLAHDWGEGGEGGEGEGGEGNCNVSEELEL